MEFDHIYQYWSMGEFDAILAHVNKVISLTREEEALFITKLTPVQLLKKTFLIEPGKQIDNEYFVLSGCLKSYYLDDSGDKHILQFAIEDWWIGDFDAFYNKVPSRLYVESIENCNLLSLSRENLETLFLEIPKFERFFRLLVTNAFIANRKRILSTLEKSSRERYLDFCEAYPSVEQRVANHDISNYLGIKPQSLSRIRRTIARSG